MVSSSVWVCYAKKDLVGVVYPCERSFRNSEFQGELVLVLGLNAALSLSSSSLPAMFTCWQFLVTLLQAAMLGHNPGLELSRYNLKSALIQGGQREIQEKSQITPDW